MRWTRLRWLRGLFGRRSFGSCAFRNGCGRRRSRSLWLWPLRRAQGLTGLKAHFHHHREGFVLLTMSGLLFLLCTREETLAQPLLACLLLKLAAALPSVLFIL